jgi:hypothetical protein
MLMNQKLIAHMLGVTRDIAVRARLNYRTPD